MYVLVNGKRNAAKCPIEIFKSWVDFWGYGEYNKGTVMLVG